MNDWKIHIDMLSDWHIGSGFGVPGGIDSLVAIDEDGLPYVPGKTTTAMLRDGAEQMVAGMDHGNVDGPWHDWLRFLFGTQPTREEGKSGLAPVPAALQIRRARLLPILCQRLGSKQADAVQLRNSLFHNKSATAIDLRSGTAVTDSLRLIQMTRGGLRLEASIRMERELSNAQFVFTEQFLAAACVLVTRIGGKRRRGAGRCQWKITTTTIDIGSIIQTFESDKFAPPEPPEATQSPNSTGSTISHSESPKVQATADSWCDIPLCVTLVDPVCIAEGVIGNVVHTLDFIPGTLLLPFLTNQLRSLGVTMSDEIQQDTIRVLPATGELTGRRSVAVPLAWELRKDAGQWQSQLLVNRMHSDSLVQSKQLRDQYVVTSPIDSGEVIAHGQPAQAFHTHNTVDEKSQRPTSDLGGVYSYQAIAPNVMRSVLRVSKPLFDRITADPNWQAKLSGHARIGRSSKDGYGRAEVTVGEVLEQSVIRQTPVENGRAIVTVLLLSDTLVLNERQQYATSAEELATAIGQSLGVSVALDEQSKKPAAFIRTRRIESWLSSWNLPRPSLIAYRAGSCLRLSIDNSDLDNSDFDFWQPLQTLSLVGLGLRRAEGYGQLAFNHPLLSGAPRIALQMTPVEIDTFGRIRRDSDAAAYAQAIEIESTCWSRLMQDYAMEYADTVRTELGWKRNMPAASQAGALRARLKTLNQWSGRAALAIWLDHLDNTKNRSDKWPNNAMAKLKRFFDCDSTDQNPGNAKVWNNLQADRWPQLTNDGLISFRSDPAHWALAVKLMIDAAIRLQQREARKPITTTEVIQHG